jgi:3-phosphoshikimate 1-carboxyvinyltransferase
MVRIIPGLRAGTVDVPSSKSIAQRVLLAASLSEGSSSIAQVEQADDVLSMLNFIHLTGAKCEAYPNRIEITGNPFFPKKLNVNMGESGLGLRLVTPLLAVKGGQFEVSGNGTLRKRPQNEFQDVFQQDNIQYTSANGFVPIQLSGQLKSGKFFHNASSGSQFLSGMLMALPLLQGDSEIQVNQLHSVPYVQLTLSVLSEFGIHIAHHDFQNFYIGGNQKYTATNLAIEGDWSAASVWFVAAALGHEIHIHGLNKNSLQADKKILTALENAGCKIWEENNIYSCTEAKNPFSFDATHCPDLFPALVCLASFMEGKSTILGADRLVHKESNRALSLQSEFAKLGVKIELVGDIMHIHGTEKIMTHKLSACNDHRIAMALAIAALQAEKPIEIEQAESVSKSYPQFWNHLNALIRIENDID